MNNRAINSLKGLACLLVVLNHFHGIGILGTITYVISHVGVPVFFLVSGYFMEGNSSKLIGSRLSRKAYHI